MKRFTHHCLINCCNIGATSCGQTKPRRPIVMATSYHGNKTRRGANNGKKKQRKDNQSTKTYKQKIKFIIVLGHFFVLESLKKYCCLSKQNCFAAAKKKCHVCVHHKHVKR